jgi:hypothetical protein
MKTTPLLILAEPRDGNGKCYLRRTGNGVWFCQMPSGLSVGWSSVGIQDQVRCQFRLESAETAEEALAVILSEASRFKSGPNDGQTVKTYAICEA